MRVEMYSIVREVTGEASVEVEAATVREALEAMARRYPPAFSERVYDPAGGLREGIQIIAGGKNIRVLGGLDAVLAPGTPVALVGGMEGG